MNLPNGTILQGGKYRIQRFISSGGFGCTYEAISTTTQQRVAIKELFVKDVSDRDEHTLTISAYSTNKSVLLNKIKKKFLEEANALKAMSHPNIVRVHESFEENGTAYYVMDYIDGQSLHDIIKQSGALSESRSLKYIKQVADALAYVHAHNRLHLDIKPGNIMIDSHDKVVLIDFGVSKQYDEANGENTSTLIGKSPGYSPVEQLGNNVQQFSPATDIYALGATLYKCVTGNTPPDATTVLSDGLPELPHSISNNIRETIKKSMSPIKGNRPQSIKAFLDSLRSPVHKKPQPSGGNNSSSSSTGIWIGVLIIVAVIGILFFANNNSNSDSYSSESSVQLPESQEEVQPDNEFEYNSPENREENHDQEIKDFIHFFYSAYIFGSYDFDTSKVSSSVLRRLRNDYDYDGEGYAVWDFRTGAQDGPDGESRVTSITAEGNGWYKVTMLDMGVNGVKRVKVDYNNGNMKIVDFK